MGCAAPGRTQGSQRLGGSSCTLMKCPGSKHLNLQLNQRQESLGIRKMVCDPHSAGFYVLPWLVLHLPWQSQLRKVGLWEQDPCAGCEGLQGFAPTCERSLCVGSPIIQLGMGWDMGGLEEAKEASQEQQCVS